MDAAKTDCPSPAGCQHGTGDRRLPGDSEHFESMGDLFWNIPTKGNRLFE
jgi:hypothetical protein